MTVPSNVEDILRAYAALRGTEVNIKFCEQDRRDAGFMGDIHYITIDNDGTPLEVVVKTAGTVDTVRTSYKVNKLYENERHFYENLWPLLKDFQSRVIGQVDYNLVPICYITDITDGKEKIVLENLKVRGFESLNKRDTFSRDHLERIFEHYGKFHAISMAFRVKKAQVFAEKTAQCHDYFNDIPFNLMVISSIRDSFEKIMKTLIEKKETNIIRKLQKYTKNPVNLLLETAEYRGKNKVINHGDCWSNNVMFRYSGNAGPRVVEELKFIDFQLARVGSPVHDLSFCMYSGGTEDIYNDLDHFLKVYHKHLSETLRRLKLKPEDLYPFETLKQEWKEYCLFGFIMGITTMKVKLVEQVNLQEILSDIQDVQTRIDEEEFRKRYLVLLKHLQQKDFL